MATVAVGDIHGNFAALDDLLTRLEPELGAGDELVFLGDYLDDGPDVRRCIDRILDLRQDGACPVVALMGNHEQWMLNSRHDHTRHSWLLGMGGLRTVASYSPEAAETIGRGIEEAGPAIVLPRFS